MSEATQQDGSGVFEVPPGPHREWLAFAILAVGIVLSIAKTRSMYGYVLFPPALDARIRSAQRVRTLTDLTLDWPAGQPLSIAARKHVTLRVPTWKVQPDRVVAVLAPDGFDSDSTTPASEAARWIDPAIRDDVSQMMRDHLSYVASSTFAVGGVLVEYDGADGKPYAFLSLWGGPSADDVTPCHEYLLASTAAGGEPMIIGSQWFSIDKRELSSLAVCPAATIVLMVLALAPVLAMDRRRRDRLQAGSCPGCGYDLRRLPERRCPECGKRWSIDGRKCATSTP